MNSRWPTVRLGDVVRIVSGGTPSRSKPAYWHGTIPWVKTAEVKNGLITRGDISELITELGLRESSARIVPAGTVLVAMYGQGGTRGRSAMLGVDAALNQACAALLPSESVHAEYLFQVLRSRYEVVRRLSNTGSQENLSAGLLRSFRIPLPPLDEQRRIADILKTWDDAIAKSERLIEGVRHRNELLARRLVEEGCDGVVALGDIAEFAIGRTPARDRADYWAAVDEAEGTHTWLTIADMKHGGRVSHSSERVTDRAVTECKMKTVEPGTVLLSFKLTLGRTAIAGSSVYTNEAIAALTPKDDAFSPGFLVHALACVNWSDAGNRAAKGRTLNREALENLLVPRVPPASQREVAAVMAQAEREFRLTDALASAYRRQREGLMQQLFGDADGRAS